MAGLSITDMDLTNGSRSVPRYGSISLRSVYESAASFFSGLGSPTNYCAATRTGQLTAAVVGAVSTNDDSTAAASLKCLLPLTALTASSTEPNRQLTITDCLPLPLSRC